MSSHLIRYWCNTLVGIVVIHEQDGNLQRQLALGLVRTPGALGVVRDLGFCDLVRSMVFLLAGSSCCRSRHMS